jgi:hypothetical protein
MLTGSIGGSNSFAACRKQERWRSYIASCLGSFVSR